MPGPVSKEPGTRARRNQASTHDVLRPEDAKGVKTPPLTAADIGLKEGRVHPLVQRWWRTIWKEPMAPRWLKSDIEGLYLIARLRHDFWSSSSGLTTLASEIRQQERRWGLDIASRRSYDWRIENSRTEPAEEPKKAAVVAEEDVDPRSLLRAVK
jgi:hypothetical protein